MHRNEWKWKHNNPKPVKVKVKSLSRVRLFATPWTVAYQAPLSMGFSRQECWSGLPFPSPGDFPDPGIEPRSPALQADALPSEPPGKPVISSCWNWQGSMRLPGTEVFLSSISARQDSSFDDLPWIPMGRSKQMLIKDGEEWEPKKKQTVKSYLGARSYIPISGYMQQYLWVILRILKFPPRGRN